jgi:hypothetical protein
MYPHDKIYFGVPGQGLLKEGNRFIDPFWSEKSLVPITHNNNYFKYNYNLTSQMVYNIMYHNDINYVHKCKYCSKPTPFISLTYGYRDFCDITCKNSYLSNLPEMRILHSKMMSDMNYENNSDSRFQAHSHFMYFINNYDLSINSKLYIAEYDSYPNLYKFGVTIQSECKKISSMGCNKFRILLESKLLCCSWIEYQLALIYNNEWISRSDIDRLTIEVIKLKSIFNNYNLSPTIISDESRILLSEKVKL